MLVFSSVVFSNSNYFEGLKVVNFLIDGQPVVYDVPAVVLNGRTMVPVKVISENLGASVYWNNNTYTVEITKPQTSAVGSDDILLMKEYVQIAFLFEVLSNFSNTFNKTIDSYWRVLDYQGTSFEIEELETLIERQKYCGEQYNKMLGWFNSLNDTYEFASTKSTMSLMYGILDDYHTSLTKFETVIHDLINYLQYGTHKTTNYLILMDEAFTLVNEAGVDAYEYYNDYIFKIINY